MPAATLMLIARAAELLRAGKLVAFPTETVYGLGADATQADAVQRIFSAKGRPGTNPLIVHVADAATAMRFADVWPIEATQLAERFWPGPLTIVLPKARTVVNAVTAGRATVGLRVPDHPLALELLRAFGGPVAAPSANQSNRVSPTTAAHVREELGDAVDLILDGGPCRVGIESTVLDLSTVTPTILRPGGVSRGGIESVIGPVGLFEGSTDVIRPAAGPGMHAVHYAPRTPAYRFTPEERGLIPGSIDGRPTATVDVAADAERYTRELYGTLRRLDAGGFAAIFVEFPPDEPAWQAVRDRVRRATRAFGAVGVNGG